ncbi:AAA family ATPase [Conexibacter sp. JD483]|uniref:chromosome segregation SMC family protein n=1 Tax=unclassified Conexibacter TaxID=2627773 RepID=UPI0027277E07|nr:MULTISPECIES: AAA family ATPase [unclassified Conexibacter]MDO8184533.1 AAA family ATPase [Conexibacter sp. CPCC 205706]MDO8197839.1 AAA family ATPase [Conexibacter sp. CPCC 205762]MDR9369245.1 AAA family ATPase [Conexibacter sp. JD483]
MHLKSLTLKGFKSFPDRTRLAFGPGVSVVVGPNGSGKSNVTDAVLWAMGEQSPLAIRGQSMQDVIFGGGHGRKASQSAEVELVLDNSDGTLEMEFAEVSILRRLDRSGDGEYRLNGARCRLADVLEVLSDTGLGKESHSVISQGRVEAIVTSKPKDRRLLIEEAAGLGKHRKRRRRAQLKLARTQDNLDRALDVEREARSRLRPLKRQAEAAELHERIERQSLEARWELGRDAVRASRVELAQAEEAVRSARARRDEAEQALGGVAKRREEAEQALQARSEQREELSGRAFRARGANERVGLRLEAIRGTAQSLNERILRHEAELVALREQAAADVVDPEVEARVAELRDELVRLERDRRAELERELAELETRRAGAHAEVERLQAVVAERRAELVAAEQRAESARAARREAEKVVETARREAARVGGELAAANQFLRSQAGAPGGAPALADKLQVDGGFELALAAALDGRLRAAVVANREAGIALLARAGRDGGSALVARPAAAAPADADAAAPPAAATPTGDEPDSGAKSPPCDGAERLLDHVRGPAETLAIAAPLLRDTWVVDDVTAVPETFSGIAVTADGRVWNGALRVLRKVPAGGEERVLAERNRRDALIVKSEEAARAEQAALQQVEAASAGIGAVDAARDAADRVQREAVRALDEAVESEHRARLLIEQRRRAEDAGPGAIRRAQIEAELTAERRLAERAERERAERDRRIAQAEARLAAEQQLVPHAERLVETFAELASAIAARVEVFDAELAAHRSAGEHVAVELRACAREEAELQGRLKRDGEAVTAAEVRAQQARDRSTEVEGELRALAERLGLEPEPASEPLPDEERAALAQRIQRLAKRREQLGPVNPLAKDEYEEALAHVEELERQRNDLEAALRELSTLIRDTDRQIRETFEETFEAAARNFEELAQQVFPGGRGRLRLVREDAGPRPVIGGQNADASEAEAAAEAAEVDSDDADERDGEEDLLGVEIEITPAGKSMKRLTLLSGGEKSMTALAFLFSVFLAKPCPFYILDEVEAALDDLNIDRFLRLLRSYRDRAQFIVVTHQKRTMEAADSLYGVSMGGDGISKVISRRLPPEQAAEAETAGSAA